MRAAVEEKEELGGFHTQKGAQAKIDGKVEADGYVEIFPNDVDAEYFGMHSSAMIECLGMCTYTCSNVEAENLYLSPYGKLVTE